MWTALKAALTGADDRRVAPRVAAFGSVKIDSQTYSLENWSASGILISGHQGQLTKGQKFKLSVDVRADQRQISFTAEAVVIRLAGDKLAAQFYRIDRQKKQAILEYFARQTTKR